MTRPCPGVDDLLSLSIDPVTLDYHLPPELIAQTPATPRSDARLMVVNRATQVTAHRRFYEIEAFLRPGDLLVFNRAQVDAARVIGRKSTGGRVEVVFLGSSGGVVWRALARPALKPGQRLLFAEGTEMESLDRTENGEHRLSVVSGDVGRLMKEHGALPLPPYIKRHESDPRSASDRADYQTVYASAPGSVAAPTAGLHFTGPLLAALREKGVETAEIVLHVGWGTFRPVAASVEAHKMLPERAEVPQAVLAAVLAARQEGRRVIAVGTTTTRALESWDGDASRAFEADTALFIRPGHRFRWVDGLLTNLHTPRSTPLALVSAFLGWDALAFVYGEAVRERYRFYSYGDAMLIV